MDRDALRQAYDNTLAVPDFPGILADFRARSAAFYGRHAHQRDLTYGPAPRQRFDWIGCGELNAPVFVFLHGGYWQKCDKEDFAFIAEGPLLCGFDVVLAEYTLAPDARMSEIVAEVGRLLDALSAPRGAARNRRLCLSGHSAGGHLAALHRGHPAVSHAMPISPLTDLEPIRLSWLNDALQLTASEVDAYSPLRHIRPGAPLTVTVGADELPELVRHSREYAEVCQVAGEEVAYLPVPGCTHFSVLDDLASPTGVQMTAVRAAMAR